MSLLYIYLHFLLNFRPLCQTKAADLFLVEEAVFPASTSLLLRIFATLLLKASKWAFGIDPNGSSFFSVVIFSQNNTVVG